MNKDNGFKSITIAFKKSNEDVRQKIMRLVDETGESKVNIVCEAVRQYDPFKKSNNINKDIIKEIVQETILNLMFNNKFQMNHSLLEEEKESKKETEGDRLKKLDNKKIDISLLDDEDD